MVLVRGIVAEGVVRSFGALFARLRMTTFLSCCGLFPCTQQPADVYELRYVIGVVVG